jgi:hypothetical protein
VLVAVAFMGMGSTVVKVVLGAPPARFEGSPVREPVLTIIAPLVFLIIVCVLGVYIPDWLGAALEHASATIEAKP